MGLELHGITIKTADDLRESLLVKKSADDFVWQMQLMIERWGLESTLLMIYESLYESTGYREDEKPLVTPVFEVDLKLNEE